MAPPSERRAGAARFRPSPAAGLSCLLAAGCCRNPRRCALLKPVEGPSRQRLLRMAQGRRYREGRTIFRQDDPCPGVFIVGSGLVRIYKLAPSGKEHVLHLAGGGQTFLEVAAILGMPCPCVRTGHRGHRLRPAARQRLPPGAARRPPALSATALRDGAARSRPGGAAGGSGLRDALSAWPCNLLSVRADQGMPSACPASRSTWPAT